MDSSDSIGQRASRVVSPNVLSSPEELFPRTDRFRIDGPPRTGGMGVVFKAIDVGLERPVAIKRIRPEFAAEETLVGRFLREARALAKLKHGNIVKVLELGSDSLGSYIVMDWIEGRSLSEELSEKTTIPVERAVHIIRQIAAGLQVAHDAGLHHRDVKPANILLDERDHAVLVDFGLVRIESEAKANIAETITGALLGTVEFISPEQLRDPRSASAASDQWSLAATMYQMVTGFSVRARDDDMLPPEIRPAIVRALKPVPDNRFPSVMAFAEALGFTGNSTIPAPASPFEPPKSTGSAASGTSVHLKNRPSLLVAPFSREQAQKSQEAWARYLGIEVEVTNSIGMKLRLIPPGTFEMGSPSSEPERGNDETLHLVTISEPKLMGVFPVTQNEWTQIIGSNPSRFKAVTGQDTGRFPVETVSWDDCQQFLDRLNRMERSHGRRYRLPTEAEWEYSCRAGTMTSFWFGTVLNGKQANCNGSQPYQTTSGPYLERTSVVGSYGANSFGLYDQHGQVLEWCQDSFGDYETSLNQDPTGPSSGSSRVLRGGSWSYYAYNCRSARRSGSVPSYRSAFFGFRVLCELS